jgi:diguanylate cyclase (GGDEF)-like protein
MEEATDRRIGWFLRGPRGSGKYQGVNIVELKRQITEKEEAEKRDNLTGLYNEKGFSEMFEKYLAMIKRGEVDLPLVVFFIDLDNFKKLNDTMGHQKGDNFLRDLANSWFNSLRKEDVLARLHGDEFAVLAFARKDDPVEERLREGFNKVVLSLGLREELGIGFSIGSAKIGKGLDLDENDINSSSPHELLARAEEIADKRMYEDKKSRKK